MRRGLKKNMTPKRIKIITHNQSDYKGYMENAVLFYQMMKQGELIKNPKLGLNAVHAAISMNDALTIYNMQNRYSGDDHTGAPELLESSSLEGAKEQATNLKRILAKKHAVAYEGRGFRMAEALEVLKQVERFYNWGLSKLPGGKEMHRMVMGNE